MRDVRVGKVGYKVHGYRHVSRIGSWGNLLIDYVKYLVVLVISIMNCNYGMYGMI